MDEATVMTPCIKPQGPRRPDAFGATQGPGVRRTYRFFFLCLFFRKRFLRLCVAILCRFLFLPQGMGPQCCLFPSSMRKRSIPLMMAVSVVNVLYFSKHAIA